MFFPIVPFTQFSYVPLSPHLLHKEGGKDVVSDELLGSGNKCWLKKKKTCTRTCQLLPFRSVLFKFSVAEFASSLELTSTLLREDCDSQSMEDSLDLASFEFISVDTSMSLDKSSEDKLRHPSLARELDLFRGEETVKPASRSLVSISWVRCFTRPGFPCTLCMLSLLELRVKLELLEDDGV